MQSNGKKEYLWNFLYMYKFDMWVAIVKSH